jgi:hypothetical protein
LAALHLASAASNSNKSIDHGIVEWLNSREGGYYNPKQEIRHEIPNDPTSMVGVFASERIEEGELLCQVPWDSLITSKEESDGEEWDEKERVLRSQCGTIRNLVREMRLGVETSKFGPFVSYLLDQPNGQLPSTWSEAGKELLVEILGGPDQKIPPEDATTHLENNWFEECGGSRTDAFSYKAAMLVLQRADDDLVVPAYDMYNHRNGRWDNARVQSHHGVNHVVKAGRTIEKGEQIYSSYNLCEECEGRYDKYGTPGK